jgi:hypothetical protein
VTPPVTRIEENPHAIILVGEYKLRDALKSSGVVPCLLLQQQFSSYIDRC